MARQDYRRLEVWMDPDLYDELDELVGSRQISATVRSMVDEWVTEERIRRKIAQMRQEAGE